MASISDHLQRLLSIRSCGKSIPSKKKERIDEEPKNLKDRSLRGIPSKKKERIDEEPKNLKDRSLRGIPASNAPNKTHCHDLSILNYS
jgi:hypothetical protein